MSVFDEIQSLSSNSASGLQKTLDGCPPIAGFRDFEEQIRDFELSLATHVTAHETPHTLFSPMHYEPGYAYPLIVWLHGQGKAAERQLMKIMPMVSMRNFVAVAPRGMECGNSGQFGWPVGEAGFHLAQQRVFDCLQIASEKCNISKRRVFLVGFDDGGTMAFRVAMQFPRYFSGVVSLCGSFPQGTMPLRQLGAVRQLPCLMCVGRDSPVFPPTEAARQMTLFHTAGMSVTVRQYPCRQELSTQMLEDLNRWIMERVTQAAVQSRSKSTEAG